MSGATASVSTHVLDTGTGRPARGVAVRLSVRAGRTDEWRGLGGGTTGPDGRCAALPAVPEGTTHARLDFAVEPYAERDGADRAGVRGTAAPVPDALAERAGAAGAFFPEVAVVFAVVPGEHYHVPLLLSPFGYSVYRGS
ncbi:hydroxyisourate hydrolase [Streptomyces sp. SID8352]|uniref:hydroxyisourate hydrolase n=1 Tax=Streptomyces sp. SID8352 TaxID=2690338 RepID=UPI00136ECCFD|nr:hydroxyisourate hydrolase [Streptomyces sp. SID8352]MYU26040.1 hydroxyisourate hydrolase [Streptomyces sp. SID8352]